MPIENGVGHGELTSLKIDHLSKIMSMHMAVTQAVLKKFSRYKQIYRYIDLTAGRGFTPDGVKGSPLVFLEQVNDDKFGLPYRADFIEQNHDNIQQLQTNIAQFCPQAFQQKAPISIMVAMRMLSQAL